MSHDSSKYCSFERDTLGLFKPSIESFQGHSYLGSRYLHYYEVIEGREPGYLIVQHRKEMNDYLKEKYKIKDPLRFEVKSDRILLFDHVFLCQCDEQQSLFLRKFTSDAKPILVGSGFTEHLYVSTGFYPKDFILALKFNNSWVFFAPSIIQAMVQSIEEEKDFLSELPKIPITDPTLPYYFREDIHLTKRRVFHANEKDYLITLRENPLDEIYTLVITEFTKFTSLPPQGCFKAIDEKKEYFFVDSAENDDFWYKDAVKIEEFSESDYPEEFKGYFGYWFKNSNGDIVAFAYFTKYEGCAYCTKFDKPVKSIHFHSRTYYKVRYKCEKHYYDIWQITYADGQKKLRIEAEGVIIPIPEDAWKF